MIVKLLCLSYVRELYAVCVDSDCARNGKKSYEKLYEVYRETSSEGVQLEFMQ
jgi:hypothetical protein